MKRLCKPDEVFKDNTIYAVYDYYNANTAYMVTQFLDHEDDYVILKAIGNEVSILCQTIGGMDATTALDILTDIGCNVISEVYEIERDAEHDRVLGEIKKICTRWKPTKKIPYGET